MTTTHASSTAAPKPVETAHKPAQASARSGADKPAATDLFSTLLGLVSDTHAAQATTPAETGPVAQDTRSEADSAADADATNPLTALLAWFTPAQGTEDSDAGKTASSPATAAQPDEPASDAEARPAGVDIEGMTRVDEPAPALPNAAAQARAAAASRPAFSPLHPNAPQATAGTARGSEGPSAQAHAPAMVWQRGAASGTEALHHQHAAQIAQARSTVALNERFGLAGAPEIAAPALREFAGAGTLGAGSPQATAPAADAAQSLGTGASADSAGGDPATDSGGDTGTGDNAAGAEAGQDADGPTVSHWGTQHLRHASLRVGGEGGSEAIDIQLQLKGQEVDVAFQTDNAEARASLRENAGESLGDLLQRSGIQLGGVSVGSQGASHGGHAQGRAPSVGGLRTESAGRASAAADLATRPSPQPRADGSRPLDVFA
jgi:flagellar hook-length control protein FliK